MLKSMLSKFSSTCGCGCLSTIKRSESIVYDTTKRVAYKEAHAPKESEDQEAQNVSSYVQAQEDLMFNQNNY
jgi:hypothetical protein